MTCYNSDQSYGLSLSLKRYTCTHVYVHTLLYLILEAYKTHSYNPD